VTVAFVNVAGYGNNLFLDNIGIDGTGDDSFDFDGDCACAVGPCTASANPRCAALIGGEFGLRLLGVMRGTEFCGAAPDFGLRTEDRMLVLGTRTDLRRFGATL